MLVVLLECEFVYGPSYVSEVRLARGQQPPFDQGFAFIQSWELRGDLPILTRDGLARRCGWCPAAGQWWGDDGELDDGGHRVFWREEEEEGERCADGAFACAAALRQGRKFPSRPEGVYCRPIWHSPYRASASLPSHARDIHVIMLSSRRAGLLRLRLLRLRSHQPRTRHSQPKP